MSIWCSIPGGFLKLHFPPKSNIVQSLLLRPLPTSHQRRLRWEEREGEVWQSESSRLTPPSALLRLQHSCTTAASQCPNFSSIFSLTSGSFFFRVPPLNLWGPGERPCFWAKQQIFYFLCFQTPEAAAGTQLRLRWRKRPGLEKRTNATKLNQKDI